MSRYYYRGSSWSDSKDAELGVGKVLGDTYTIYAGVFDDNVLYKPVAPGRGVEELPWFTPEGFDGTPYIERRRGVTGGLTESVGTAMGFASGIQLVFYINQSSLNGRSARVQYKREWMTEFEGALAHIVGEEVSGEIHDQDTGVVGLTREDAYGPVVQHWGPDSLDGMAMAVEEEREVIVQAPSIDLTPCCDAIAIVQMGRVTPQKQLLTLDGAGINTLPESAYPVNELNTEEAQDLLHQEIRERAAIDPQGLISLNLSTTDVSTVGVIPESAFEYAYTQQDGFLDYDEAPGYLLGEL